MAQNALVVLKVSCVMAGDMIPASLCETEQGGMLCSGCQAPTRRCAACNQAKGIADARRGLCGKCLAANSADEIEHRGNAQLLEEASNNVLDLIDQMSEEQPVTNEAARVISSKSAAHAPAAKRLDLEVALGVLAEHGVNKPDGQFVPNPVRVLALRFGLLPAEAMSTVQALSDAGKIMLRSEATWRFLVDVSDVIRSRDEIFTSTGMPSRAYSVGQPTAKPSSGIVKPKAVYKPTKRDDANPPAIYKVLVEAAQMVGGNMVVRGAIPLLITRMRLKPHQAIELLEQLASADHVRQVDEWRSICLLGAPAVSKPGIVQTQPEASVEPVTRAKTRLDPFTGVRARKIEPQARKPRAVLPPTAETSALHAQPAAPDSVSTPVDIKPREEQKTTSNAIIGPTVSDLFDAISGMSTDLNGERLARAAVPTLSVRFSLGIPDIIVALERLEQQKAIERKDGWRSILVLIDRVDDNHPVRTALPSARERAEKLNLRVVDGGEQGKPVQPVRPAPRPVSPELPRVPKRPIATPSSSASPGHSVSEELSELRRSVEILNRQIAVLVSSSQSKVKESAPEPESKPRLPKVKVDQHELLLKDELWLTDEAMAKRLGELSSKRCTVRQFHIKVAPLANGVRIVHGLCGDGSIRTFYSSKDVLNILHKRIFGSSR
jgi:hypothetical protein